MGFEVPNWAEVAPVPPIIPEGNFTFQLIGGQEDERGAIVVTASVNDGEFAGRRVTFSYPTDPVNSEWSRTLFRRLLIALGDDILEGEKEVDFLNRVAGNTFGGTMYHNTWTDKETGDERTSAKFKLSKARAG